MSFLTWLLSLVEVGLVEEEGVGDPVAHLIRQNLRHLQPAQHARHVEQAGRAPQLPVLCTI